MILLFVAGFLSGALCLLILAILLLFNVFGKRQPQPDQFPAQIPSNKTRIPSELKAFLRSAPDGNGSEWESCSSLSLLLHFLFQEHKDTRQFRRWMYKKLQLELNDVTARSSAAGRIIQGIQIRDLEAGTNSPMVRNVRIERFGLAEDDPDMFEELVLLLDLDYRGGFQMSVDALMAFGKFAQLSVKLLNLSGRARLTIRRQPFAHWSLSFVENPQMELKIESQFQGRNLRHLIPLIGSAFRKVLQLKHVWPNYKLRFRPFFQNPLFDPSPNFASLEHIQLAGSGLEVTFLSASRLNTSLGIGAPKLYCEVILEKRPYGGGAAQKKEGNGANTFRDASHLLSVLLAFSRKGAQDKLGLSFASNDGKEVRVEKVEPGSNGEKCGFRVGDCLVAVNNIPVRNERQASRLLTGTAGDLMILVERESEGGERREATPFTLSPPESPPAPPADDGHFELPDTPPMEFRAKDEEMEEGGEEEEFIRMRRCNSKEDDGQSMEMRPLAQRRPSSLQETPKRPEMLAVSARMSTPISPSTPQMETNKIGRIVEAMKKEKKRKMLKKLVRNGGGSFRAAKITRKGGGGKKGEAGGGRGAMRRSRSESSLVRLKVPEVLIEGSEEDLDNKSLDESTTPLFGPNLEEAPEKASTSTGSEEMDGGIAEATPAGERGTSMEKEKQQQQQQHWSRRERLHAKANEMAKAGRTKFNDIFSRRKTAELAIEANDEAMTEERPPSPSARTTITTTMDHLEKPKKKINRKKNKSPSPSFGLEKSKSSDKIVPDSCKRTKSVPMAKNPIWGQSIHFGLQRESAYLNVLVYGEKDETTGQNMLLGYTSIYVPRIVDDCMLTLSNCHRERFHLKGPKENEHSLPADLDELSKHNGFDPRLCFGDIVLGFRVFPDGLPEELMEREGRECEEEEKAAKQRVHAPTLLDQQAGPSTQSGQSPSPPADHKWANLHPKQVAGLHFSCGLCGGKIWLKGGTRCERCNLVCHNSTKCQERARAHECRPAPAFSFNDDAAFEELDTKELDGIGEAGMRGEKAAAGMEARKSATEEQIGAAAATVGQVDPSKSGFRRRKIAEKLQTTLKHMGGHIRRSKVEMEAAGGSESPESPSQQNGVEPADQSPLPLIAVSQVLDQQFLHSLEGFPPEVKFNELRFEPGNAYNPQVICEAKAKGQHIFGEWKRTAERKAKINGQIDRVQTMIEKVTRERRSIPDKTGEKFDQVDNRLQALALVMLLYCSALSDCVDREEAEEGDDEKKRNGQMKEENEEKKKEEEERHKSEQQ